MKRVVSAAPHVGPLFIMAQRFMKDEWPHILQVRTGVASCLAGKDVCVYLLQESVDFRLATLLRRRRTLCTHKLSPLPAKKYTHAHT